MSATQERGAGSGRVARARERLESAKARLYLAQVDVLHAREDLRSAIEGEKLRRKAKR